MSPIGDLARQDEYDLPDVGPPLISGGPQFSPGLPAVNQAIGSLLAPRQRDENSPVAYRTASPLVNITEQDINDATEAAQAFSGGGLGIKAYHSSPHDFDKFDLSKIGTGEGAQVYGHGLYFAENPAVSGQGGQYWRQFLPRFAGPEQKAASSLQTAGFDREAVMANLQKNIADVSDHMKYRKISDPLMAEADRAHWQKLKDQWQAQHDLLASGKPVGPRTYEVDIKADPAHFLDWDKPLSQMSPEVQQRLKDAWLAHPEGHSRQAGNQIYDTAGMQSGMSGADAARYATRTMEEAGIPGIKYLDQSSRQAANLPQLYEGAKKLPPLTSNYVVFNPGIIDILRKYGIAAAPTGALGALAAQDQYNQP